MKLVSALIGSTMVAAGAAKLARIPAYEEMTAGLEWSDAERGRIGSAELLGGALMLLPATRHLGAAVVLAACGSALVTEVKSGRIDLAVPRSALLLGALAISAVG